MEKVPHSSWKEESGFIQTSLNDNPQLATQWKSHQKYKRDIRKHMFIEKMIDLVNEQQGQHLQNHSVVMSPY